MASLILLKAVCKSRKKKKVKLKSGAIKATKLDLSMCRICYAEQGKTPIFNEFAHHNIPEEIKNFSGVTISAHDQLPQNICQKCLDLLDGCIMFRQLCQKTNKELIEISIKKESNLNNIKDEDQEDMNINESNDAPLSPTSNSSELLNYINEFYESKSKPDPDVNKRIKGENKNKTHLCDTCGKTAKSKASLLVHMSTHENIFPYKCEECPYQGRTMDLLKVHKRTHLADKPFKCSQCPKACSTSSNLAKHMRHIHSTSRPHKCTYCEKAFSYQHDMKRHVRDIHLRTSTVECDVCYKKFNTKKILQGHRWKIHKIKGERLGRLPSYLQCQEARTGGEVENNIHCETDVAY